MKQGMTTISRTLNQELERRFSCFLDPLNSNFKPIYVVATSLDLRYRVVLSDDQIHCASSYLRTSCYSESEVSLILCWFAAYMIA